MASKTSWFRDHRRWLEAFVLVNLALLGPDIYLAHSTNSFAHRAEYIPLRFSVAAPVLLLAANLSLLIWSQERIWRWTGYVLGWTAIGIGVVGLIFHLESHFFREQTLESLVYTAPFAAPLAYSGIGLLLIMNRMVADALEWAYWVLLLALGGFVGNFIFSLADHAQNGFFHATEWIPVASSALAIGFLLVPLIMQVNQAFLVLCIWIL